jgi:capsular polysaccharide transport system permease protein
VIVQSHAEPSPSGFVSCLRKQLRVVGALMLREAMTRYGHENIGFFWLMVEPLLLTLGVTITWLALGQAHGTGVDVVSFILTGYTMITLWRHVVAQSVRCLRDNVGLLFHMNVRAFDIVLARTALETAGGLAAFFIAYAPLTLFGIMEPMSDPLVLLSAWFLMAWFSFGVALNIAALTEIFHPIEYFVQPLMYLIIPIQGTFFMVSWLPDGYRDIVLWMPLVHANEMYRAGLLPAQIETFWNPWYLVVWCVALTATGLPLVRRAREHVHMT